MEQRTKIRELRLNATPAERALWRHLNARQVRGTRFNRQVAIGPFICDFVARSAKLVIEVDGGQHGWSVEQDRARTDFIERQGYRVIRFWNDDVLDRIDGVISAIEQALATPLPQPLPQAGGESFLSP